MVDFAGYSLPVRYPLGVMKEHLHVRQKCGLFDISHMGLIRIANHGDPKSGLKALQYLTPTKLEDMEMGQARYTVLLNERGCLFDDIIVYAGHEYTYLVVNAGRKHADFAHLKTHLPDHEIDHLFDSHSIIALQGPKTEEILCELYPEAADALKSLYFMEARCVTIEGQDMWASRTGYTGEDGFEFFIRNEVVEFIATLLLRHPDIEPIGLGARDSLRLEAGMPLFGQDLHEGHRLYDVNLDFIITEGHQHIGCDIFEGHDYLRVGLVPEGRAPIRNGEILYDYNKYSGESWEIGRVTSGCFSPTLQKPIAMGYIDLWHNIEIGHRIFVYLRGKRISCHVVKPQHIKPNYKRRPKK